MSNGKSQASDETTRKQVDIRSADTGVERDLSVLQSSVDAGMEAKGETRRKLEIEKTKVTLENGLKEIFKDKEAVTQVMSVVAIGILAYVFTPEKNEKWREETEEPVKKDIAELDMAGLLEGEIKAAEAPEETLELKIENSDRFYEAYIKALKAGYPDIDVNNFKNKSGKFKKIFQEVVDNKQSFDPYDIKAWEGQFRDLFEKGLIAKDDLREIYPYAINIDVERDYQLIAIQLKAAMNKRNTAALAKAGVTIPQKARKLSAIGMFKQGIGSYNSFKQTLINHLQPDEKDPKKQVDNVANILSRSALGKYQILPIHHFGKLNWPFKGEAGLKKMHEYLKSPSMQEALNREILKRLARNFEGNPYAMAATYYATAAAGKKMLEYRKQLAKSGTAEMPDWMEKKQVFGFGSINYYASKVAKYYGRAKVDPNNPKDILDFQKAIEKKETGFLKTLKGKKAKSSTAEVV